MKLPMKDILQDSVCDGHRIHEVPSPAIDPTGIIGDIKLMIGGV